MMKIKLSHDNVLHVFSLYSKGKDPACNLEPEKGICYLPKSYYFDKDDKICRKYSPLECKGNQNKFSTEEECLKTCGDCSSEPERGPCKAEIPRYYFDKDENICKEFIYGGCEGNLNNYETKKDCFKTCGDCNSKPDRGPCLANIPRFYFDQDHKTCKRFDYGGCLGNNNNFQTKEICYEACQDKPIADGKYSIFQCNERIF